MAEQECHQEKLQQLEAEDKLIVAGQEAAALTCRLQVEKEETERRTERERQEAAFKETARREFFKKTQEVERLEELKKLNAARARLQVYDEKEVLSVQGIVPQCSEPPTVVQENVMENPVDQHPQQLRDQIPKGVLQDDMSEFVKVLAEAISANRLPIPEPTIFSGDPLSSKGEVHYVCKMRIKELITPSDVIKVLESDFSERDGEEATFLQEDLCFLNKLKEEIRHKQDGHYEMPLPFKQDRPNLPDNKLCAVQHLMCLERKLKRDQKYCSDYVNFMKELSNQPVWIYTSARDGAKRNSYRMSSGQGGRRRISLIFSKDKYGRRTGEIQKVNDIVILQEDSSPRNQRRLARVTEVYPSTDERVRKVKLLISDSTLDSQGKWTSKPVYLDRPVQKTVLQLEAE
ncbi:hypothetical protein MHYP_G00264550 [Metynnis hypsauchen]